MPLTALRFSAMGAFISPIRLFAIIRVSPDPKDTPVDMEADSLAEISYILFRKKSVDELAILYYTFVF